MAASAVMGAMGNRGGEGGEGAPPQQGGAAPHEGGGQAGQQSQNPCQYEMDEFLSCARNQSGNLDMCSAFNDAFKQCKLSFGTFASSASRNVCIRNLFRVHFELTPPRCSASGSPHRAPFPVSSVA
jgi:hypothetical protein